MTLPAPQSLLMALGLAALVMWRVYKRIRRLVGRQKLSPVRPWFTVILFPVLIAVMALATLAQPQKTLMLAAGLSLGVALGIYGHRLTRFEVTPQGFFYTPNAHLGVALSLLFIGRLVYRLASVYLLGSGVAEVHIGDANPPHSMGYAAFLLSGWTLAIFGTLGGYYVAYAVGLLRWRFRIRREQAAAATPQP